MAINKMNGAIWADISKVDNVAVAGISKVSNEETPALGATTCVIASQDGYFAWSTGSADAWAASTWHFYRTALTADDANDLDYGLDNLGNPFWMCTINKTARPTYYSTSSVPLDASAWTTAFDTINSSKVAYGVTYGINANASIANWVVVGDDCRVSEVTNDVPQTVGNWTLTSRLSTGFASGAQIRDVAFNNDVVSPIFIAVTNNSRIASSPDGSTWTVRQAGSNTDHALWRVVYGNGVWVACGYYGNMKHMTGSADGETWGAMNLPSGDPTRQMYGAANDGGNNWVMVGNGGYVWTSADNAVSWTEVRITDSRGAGKYTVIYNVAHDGAGTWVMSGGASEIWTSTDNGANWTNLINVADDWVRDAYQNFHGLSFNRT